MLSCLVNIHVENLLVSREASLKSRPLFISARAVIGVHVVAHPRARTPFPRNVVMPDDVLGGDIVFLHESPRKLYEIIDGLFGEIPIPSRRAPGGRLIELIRADFNPDAVRVPASRMNVSAGRATMPRDIVVLDALINDIPLV